MEEKRVARGTKSEHGAVVLRAGTRELWLRKRGGPSFGDRTLRALIGQELDCEGTLAGPTLILDRWKEVAMAKPAKARASGRASRAKKTRARAVGKKLLAKTAAPLTDADKIRHVVLLMLENRSFDQMLGGLQASIPAIDGVLPPGRSNSAGGIAFPQQPGAARKVDPDPQHATPHVLRQLAGGNGGFAADYAAAFPATSASQRQQVMSYFADGSLPALHALARSFVVCDRWHSSVPGPTWTNRLFAMSGTSAGIVDMPSGPLDLGKHAYGQPSVFRRLAEAKRSYRIYFGDFPLALLLSDQRSPSSAKHFRPLDRFFADAAGDEKRFPDFAFLEPDYLWPGANDDHPPHDVAKGQKLIARVYRALRANPALWASTLLLVTYDEHGGFYDHIAPPPAPPPDGKHTEYSFDRLGVRVPAVLVSPWLASGVCHSAFDHTSLLRLLQRKWSLGSLGLRTAAANDPLHEVALLPAARTDTPATLPVPAEKKVAAKGLAKAAAAPPLSDHQQAIVALSQALAPSAAKAASKGAKGAKRAPSRAPKTSAPAPSAAAAARSTHQRTVAFFKARGVKL
ncbi:MAG TPA: alkaline phosphatase family protein [Myxococcota bacterium]